MGNNIKDKNDDGKEVREKKKKKIHLETIRPLKYLILVIWQVPK